MTKEELFEFCWNSRKWCIFMFSFPESCPHQRLKGKNCDEESCGYCKLRKLSPYAKRKLKILQGAGFNGDAKE